VFSKGSNGSTNEGMERRENERRFVNALKKKKMWAYERLYDEYSGIVGGIARSYLNIDDVEDVIQEVFIRVYKSIKRFKGQSSFSTWLYRIAVNVCKDQIKKQARRSETFTDFDEGEESGFSEPEAEVDVENQVNSEIRIERFREIMQDLSEEDRLFITLRDIEGLDYEEISKVVDKPLGTVKSRLYYARKRLKKLLKNSSIGEDF